MIYSIQVQIIENKKSGFKYTKMTNKIKTPPEDRIYDDNDGFFLRAASVCVKDHNETEVNISF